MHGRRHRLLSIPSALLILVCLGLPGFRGCGHHVPMSTPPFGLLVLVPCGFMLANTSMRTARGIAIAGMAFAAFTLLVMVCVAILDSTYVGFDLTMLGWTGFGTGSLLWLLEIGERERDITPVTLLLVLGLGIAGAKVAANATWTPEPDEVEHSGWGRPIPP